MPNPTEIAGQYRALATILDARERRVGSPCGNRCSRLYPEIASLWQLSAKLRFAYRWEPPLSLVPLTLPFDATRCPDGLKHPTPFSRAHLAVKSRKTLPGRPAKIGANRHLI